ncbi:MAG TPA: MFS transporter [Acidimicrobiales bacterium]|nr:MFS transporter [Acidimicrobiales bacterium]
MILAIACVAQFMVVLDVSIVNVALPSIGRDLHYSPTGLQWVVNAYVLTFAGFLLLGGRAADLFGRRRVYMAGLGLFTLASLVGGLAENSTWLTAARAAQGFGGAMLSPATLTIIVTTFTGAKTARALGIWSSVAGAGGAAGVLLGGVLTAEISWRWVLFVNLPIGIAALAVASMFLTESRRPAGAAPKLDITGAILVTGGLGVLIYAIVGTDNHAWGSSQTLTLLAVAVAVLAVFGVVEARFASSPLVPFRLFRSRAVSGANVVMFLIGAAFFSMWYFLSLYLQNVLGYGALKAGLAFFPMGVAIIIGAQTAARLIPRLGVRPLLQAGTLLTAVGFLGLSLIGAHSNYWVHVFIPGCIVSFAIGILFTPLASAATSGVHFTEAGLASGVLNTSRQMGGSLGLALLATIATERSHSLLHKGVAPALTSGYARAFEVATGVVLAAFIGSFVVPVIRAAHSTATSTSTEESGVAKVAEALVDGEESALPTLDPA